MIIDTENIPTDQHQPDPTTHITSLHHHQHSSVIISGENTEFKDSGPTSELTLLINYKEQ